MLSGDACGLLLIFSSKKTVLENVATGLALIGSLHGTLRSACPLECSPGGYAEEGGTANRGANEAT